MQDREARRHLLIGRVGVPVGRALDPEPVDVAVFVDIGQPRHFGMFDVPIIDQRMDLRFAEAPPKRGQFSRSQVLLAEHQHRMLGKGVFDPRRRSPHRAAATDQCRSPRYRGYRRADEFSDADHLAVLLRASGVAALWRLKLPPVNLACSHRAMRLATTSSNGRRHHLGESQPA